MPNYNVLSLFTNYIFVSAVSAWIIAQLAKVVVNIIKKDKIMLRGILFDTGGMPSSHSAVVCSTAISCGILYGYDSVVFAIAAIVAFVVMRDAAGVRREAGKQAEVINQISEELSKKKRKIADITLPELLGHTPLQVVFGALLGFMMAYLCQRVIFVRFF